MTRAAVKPQSFVDKLVMFRSSPPDRRHRNFALVLCVLSCWGMFVGAAVGSVAYHQDRQREEEIIRSPGSASVDYSSKSVGEDAKVPHDVVLF